MLKENSSNIFSTNIKDYVAFGCIEIKFNQNNFIILPSILLHIPIVKENDGLYYSLCCEWNDVTYGSSVKKSFNRMLEKVTWSIEENIQNKSLASLFTEEGKMKSYKKIFNEMRDKWNTKNKINEREAKKIDLFLEKKNIINARTVDNKKVIFTSGEDGILAPLGEAEIDCKYLEKIVA